MVAGWGFSCTGIAQSVLLFRHPESNRSTPYRVGVLAAYVLGCWLFGLSKGCQEPYRRILLSLYIGYGCMWLLLLIIDARDEVIGRAFVELPKKLHRILMFPLPCVDLE